MSRHTLTKSALYLLQTLPVARHAVLEYLCNVFEESVQVHMRQMQFNEYNRDDIGLYNKWLCCIVLYTLMGWEASGVCGRDRMAGLTLDGDSGE